LIKISINGYSTIFPPASIFGLAIILLTLYLRRKLFVAVFDCAEAFSLHISLSMFCSFSVFVLHSYRPLGRSFMSTLAVTFPCRFFSLGSEIDLAFPYLPLPHCRRFSVYHVYQCYQIDISFNISDQNRPSPHNRLEMVTWWIWHSFGRIESHFSLLMLTRFP